MLRLVQQKVGFYPVREPDASFMLSECYSTLLRRSTLETPKTHLVRAMTDTQKFFAAIFRVAGLISAAPEQTKLVEGRGTDAPLDWREKQG